MPDGTIITNVPDGITQADLASRYAAHVQSQPSGTDSSPPLQLGKINPALVNRNGLPMTGADVAMGARQPIDAGAQMLTRGLAALADKIAPGSSAAQWLDSQRQGVEDVNRQAFDAYQQAGGATRPAAGIGRAIGQGAVTALMAPLRGAASIPAVMGQGAGIGALSGALTPVYDPTDFAQQKLGQVAQGAAPGALTAGAVNLGARAIAPVMRPAVQAMLDAGVTPTPGQMLGGFFKTAEEKATSLPIVGDAIRYAQRAGLGEYNTALYNRILQPLGLQYKGPAGQEGIAAVGDTLSNAYESLLARSAPTPIAGLDGRLNSLAAIVPTAKRQDFVDAMQREVFDKVTPGGTLTPSVAKDAESAIGRLIRAYRGSPGDDQLLADAYQQAQAELRNQVAQANPETGPAIQQVNKAWSDLVQLENAANSTKAARAGGIVTPADQLRGIKRADTSVRDRRFARGEMPNQDFAQAADSVLSNTYPDSGSIGRLLLGGGLLGGGAMLEPTTLGAAGLASLPYLPGGRQAMAAIMARRPAIAAPMRDAITAVAPYLGVGSGLFGL